MSENNYRENLRDALINLIECNRSIYSSIINLEMQGNMKDWSDAVPIGESHQFDFEIFRNSEDSNIQQLVKLIDVIDGTYESLKNINGLEIGLEKE